MSDSIYAEMAERVDRLVEHLSGIAVQTDVEGSDTVFEGARAAAEGNLEGVIEASLKIHIILGGLRIYFDMDEPIGAHAAHNLSMTMMALAGVGGAFPVLIEARSMMEKMRSG